MKPRHAAALALVIWCLGGRGGITVPKKDCPNSNCMFLSGEYGWGQCGFKTKAECEAARDKWIPNFYADAEKRPTGRLPTFDASMRTAADPAKMKPRRYAAALMLLVLAISMAGCGSSNNSSCSTASSGDKVAAPVTSAEVTMVMKH